MKIKKIENKDCYDVSIYFNKLVMEKPGIAEDFTVDPNNNPFIEKLVENCKNNKIIAYIARDESNVYAFGHLNHLDRKIDHHVGELHFGVLKNYDDWKVSIIKRILKEAKDLDFEVVTYYILSTNERFINIVKKAGLEKAGETYDYPLEEHIVEWEKNESFELAFSADRMYKILIERKVEKFFDFKNFQEVGYDH